MYIKNARLYLPHETVTGDVMIKDGKIEAILTSGHMDTTDDDVVIDAQGHALIPGFIDTHIHGANGVDVMDPEEDAILKMAEHLVTEGTTAFLATTMTESIDAIETALAHAGQTTTPEKTAELLGVHLEGPFVNTVKKGAQPEQHIIKPDLDLFKRWQALSHNKIKTVTMAPEEDTTGSFVKALRETGVNVSMGHTDVTFEQAKEATTLGVNQVTHLCNQMNGIHHRDVGLVGASFLLPALQLELIADGIHVSQEMLQLIYNNVGSDRLILITDAMRAKGLEDGTYTLGGQTVNVKDKKATLADGTLAGSVLPMIDGARRMLTLDGATLRDIIQMASINPARQLGVYDRKGSIDVGKDADLLIVTKDLQLIKTITKGEIAYEEDV
ncbi:N-acetylglucosamine-6-phosphate deacetylase [Halolactibacillus alkaliphilus]|uniref:N-acetylglucosamine-6-phosphate deacetylase n=1 Tax=Halolactibacillus alkaliphilus TaxID=442899 RepID=A0A511X3L1_9BACI|nr:N-acetylglucosamine-6-phosphate deacetylase [Halolactibacillus alkaliphilus]GEN57538.1 N-acetylglucosamine-6-phosphate deacetylase [Halolactibacillus alkaliphilus]GGN73425.1 N-acetylglucosamine-6-phosphate deacetylase [Halolactibacillus alkaliphilus]SFO95873.1 N-acetylglucosamine 6-phosphate deacetylase [Halolactibacillus alkaliphilus]